MSNETKNTLYDEWDKFKKKIQKRLEETTLEKEEIENADNSENDE